MHQLRLWQPDPEEQLTCFAMVPAQTLSGFFRNYYRDVGLLGSRPSTVEGYQEAITHWVKCTGDPPLETTDRLTFSRFVSRLLAVGLSRRTVRKHAVLVNAMVEEAGYPAVMTRQIRKSLRQSRQPPDGDWCEAEVRQMLAGAARMQRSGKTAPLATGAWWRLFVLSAYFLGEHRDEVLSIRMADVDLAEGFVRIPERQKTRKSCWKPLHPGLADEIRATVDISRERLLPWRNWDNERWETARNSRADFHRRFLALLKASGILEARWRLGTRGFRKLHLTRLAEQSWSAAQGSANHTDIAVTLGHYVSGQVQEFKRRAELSTAILGLPAIEEEDQ